MPNAFVTGATGFVGANLVRELEASGFDVVALHRPTSDLFRLEGTSARRVTGDVADRAAVLAALPEAVDAVFHVAASTNVWSRENDRQTRTNVEGTRVVADAARVRRAGRFVHTSSIAAWGSSDSPVDETRPQNGASSWVNYIRTKALAEVVLREEIARGLDAVIVNPANILGPLDTSSWARMIRLVHAGKMPVVPPGRGSFCHVREVCRAHIAALERGGTGRNYLLGGTDAAFIDLVRIVCRLAGRTPPRRTMPRALIRLYARASTAGAALLRRRPGVTPEAAHFVCHDLLCRSERAVSELGYRAIPLEIMVEDSWRWLRDAGLLEENAAPTGHSSR